MVVPGQQLSKEREVTPEASPTHSVPIALSNWTTGVDQELQRSALAIQSQPERDSLLGRMAAYHMGWVEADGSPARAGGKHVRSNLCCWAAVACGGSAEAALPAACAVELAHNFTLVHDDVQDGDRQRRGRPAVWSVWGAPQAINAGDGLCALAFRTLLGDRSGMLSALPKTELATRAVAAQVLLDALIEVIEGQCLDLQHECRPDTPLPTYLRMVEAKTGALLGASLEAGAVMAGADPDLRGHLRRAGRQLGVAFQLRDDWLGVWGEPALTGKSRENDLSRRKLTHPVVAAYQAAGREQRQELEALYQSRGPDDEPRIRHLLEVAGGPEPTASAAPLRAAEATEEIRRCGFDPVRLEEFADVAQYIAERDR
jgi:geranylgeranyl diphosphate synthase type I